MNIEQVREIVRSMLIKTYPPQGMASLVRKTGEPPSLEVIVREIVRAEISSQRAEREGRAEKAEYTVSTFADRLNRRAHRDDLEELEERVEALERKAGEGASETRYVRKDELGRTTREDVASKVGSPSPAPLDESRVREIVREEAAERDLIRRACDGGATGIAHMRETLASPQPSPSSVEPKPAAEGDVPNWVPSDDDIQDCLQSTGDYLSLDSVEAIRRLIASRVPRHASEAPQPPRVGVRRLITVGVEQAARALVDTYDALHATPNHEESRALHFAEDQCDEAWSSLRAALSALPASNAPRRAEGRWRVSERDLLRRAIDLADNEVLIPRDEYCAREVRELIDAMRDAIIDEATNAAVVPPLTLPPSKTLTECRDVFVRVTKRGPCLSSPDLHGIAAVRDFLTLDEEAFRRNWGARDEDDDERCEGGECRHGFDAGGGEHLTECEKHGGKSAPAAPQPARAAHGEPTIEECLSAYWLAHNAHETLDQPVLYGIAAVRALCLSRAPSPAPALAELVVAADVMRAWTIHSPGCQWTCSAETEPCDCGVERVRCRYDRARAALEGGEAIQTAVQEVLDP